MLMEVMRICTIRLVAKPFVYVALEKICPLWLSSSLANTACTLLAHILLLDSVVSEMVVEPGPCQSQARRSTVSSSVPRLSLCVYLRMSNHAMEYSHDVSQQGTILV